MFLRGWKNRVGHGTLCVLAMLISATLCTALLRDGRDAWSIGHFLQGQSIVAREHAFASSAAAAEDWTKIFANRAGMTGRDGSVEGEADATMIPPQAESFDRGSTVAIDGALARLRA
jgi:hypothetical protein